MAASTRTTQHARHMSYLHAHTHTQKHTWLNQLNTRDECVPSSPDRILKFDYRAIPPLGTAKQHNTLSFDEEAEENSAQSR